MSRLTELIARTKGKDAQLGADLEREFKTLRKRTDFQFWYRNPQQPGQSSLGIA